MKTKILLFNLPPSGGSLFPISLGYIAASLKNKNFETAIAEIDTITPGTGQSIADFVLKFKPAIAGFSVYQANTGLAVQLAKLVKMIDPRILVVIGGPQATFMPSEALLQMPCVDVISRGEGEVVLPELAGCLKNKRDISGVKNITFRSECSIVDTPRKPFSRDLDSFVSPYKYR
ncbi:MAG: cobalamin-dependent protein, partial [Candidatus Omnitrophica bacterium]|nr:cobalamin-dependent protein [Candidatus Omnitrophota bacterium]